MRIYKVVKKEENPTISINKVNMENGFLIVTVDDVAIGIIVYNSSYDHYILIADFYDDFSSGIKDPRYYNEDLEKLMEEIKSDYTGLVEFNFISVVQ